MKTSLAPPKARPAVSGVAIVLGLGLVALAVVAVRDLAVNQDWASGSAWTVSVVERINGLTAGPAVVASGVVLVLAGVALAWTAAKPARRTHDAAPGDADLWITPAAIRSVAVAASRDTPGVADATVRSRRGALVVTIRSSRDDLGSLAAAAETTVSAALHGLTDRTITIRTKKVEHGA